MRTSDRRACNYIMKHKEYFDEKLISLAGQLEADSAKLSSKLSALKSAYDRLKALNRSYRDEISLLRSDIRSLNRKNIELENEKDDLARQLGLMQLKIEEMTRTSDEQKKEVAMQRRTIERYEKTIDRIRHANSTNSNSPSSMDVLSHTKARSVSNSRKRTGRKRGGQPDHAVHRSRLSKKADRIINVTVKKAPSGAEAVRDEAGHVQYYATQEVDLSLKSIIVETRYYISRNGTDTDRKTMKKYAINPLTYSDHFKAAVVYLNQRGTIPLQRLSDMMNEISGGSIDVRPGTIVKWCHEINDKSRNRRDEILHDIISSEVVHVDETSFSVNSEKSWIHAITNDRGAYFVMTEKRGDDEKGPLHLLEGYSGILVHDHFRPYQKLQLCQHAECNAHIDRYLQNGIDFDHSSECEKLLELLHKILHEKKELISKGIFRMDEERIRKYEDEYVNILEDGLRKYEEQHPDIESRYEAGYIKTFRRMLKYKEDHLRFMKDFKVPYTNNAAEKQCRAIKGHKNISKQFVTIQGGETYVGILTLLQTAIIKKESALEALISVLH